MAIKPVNPVQNEEQSWESNLAIKQVPGVENEVLEELRRLYAATDPVVIDDRMSGARSLTRANLGRMDDAMKSALLAAIAEGVEQAWVSHDVRPEQTNSTFRNLVLRGYLLARVLYGSEMCDFHYSATKEEVRINVEELIAYAGSLNVDAVISALSDEVTDARYAAHLAGITSKYGEAMIEAAAVFGFVQGATLAIAEHELFANLH